MNAVDIYCVSVMLQKASLSTFGDLLYIFNSIQKTLFVREGQFVHVEQYCTTWDFTVENQRIEENKIR